MQHYMTYPVQAVEFDGDDGAGLEHLGDLLREVADWLDDLLDTRMRRPSDNTRYDLSVTLEQGRYTAILYVFNGDAEGNGTR